jgi:hypothetical protein
MSDTQIALLFVAHKYFWQSPLPNKFGSFRPENGISSWNFTHIAPIPTVVTIQTQAMPLDHLILHGRAFLHFKRIA